MWEKEEKQVESLVGKIPWRRAWQHTLVFLPGEPHGQRSQATTVHGVTRVGHNLVTKPITNKREKKIILILRDKEVFANSQLTFMIKLTFSCFFVVQLLTHFQLFVIPWPAAHQAPLSSTISPNFLKFMSIELVMLSNHLILCHPLLFLPSIFPHIRVFSNESALHIR